MPIIKPSKKFGSGRDGSLSYKLTPDEITKRLGLDPVAPCDDGKTVLEWAFTIDGKQCGIWDYKGSRWSYAGPKEALVKVFPEYVEN
jgi:hypothetical protein